MLLTHLFSPFCLLPNCFVVRYFVVWLPLLMLVIRFVLYEAGMNMDQTLIPAGGANGTLLGLNTTMPIVDPAGFPLGDNGGGGGDPAMPLLLQDDAPPPPEA